MKLRYHGNIADLVPHQFIEIAIAFCLGQAQYLEFNKLKLRFRIARSQGLDSDLETAWSSHKQLSLFQDSPLTRPPPPKHTSTLQTVQNLNMVGEAAHLGF